MVSFYVREDLASIMKTKTGDFDSLFEHGIPFTPETVFVGIPGEYPSEDGKPINTLENAHGSSSFDAVEVSTHLGDSVQTNTY
jgi:hypothetical protein